MDHYQPQRHAHRYHLLELLGRGGMGVVYRAYDRLTGQNIALKQVQVAPQALTFASRPATGDTRSLLLALAQEFKLLASLRHPHIISVLDYGFDTDRQPYFTMDLLEQPQTLVEAGRGQPLTRQVDLLAQTLQALAYLHRRGILHRDLKPENVLVSQGQVRVLDFGLAILREQARRGDEVGTLLYIPPEVLDGVAHTEAADLYTMGILIYEMLVGRHPFYSADLQEFLDRLWQNAPNLAPLAPLTAPSAPVTVPAVLQRLLARQPADRYPTAETALADLCLALGQPLPAESIAIRESFLQAATFVGREAEMAQLNTALANALQGQGSAWLIGGESGVGKSRLLEELRTQALVSGALVLRGQAVEGGGQPYQLWYEPVRRLLLTTELSDLEAGVLQEIVPEIATLLERPVPPVPLLSGQARRQRLLFTVVELFKRHPLPLVLLLEDLQWSSASLMVLQQLTRTVTTLPLLIVANYRDDEQPHLPATLPDMQVLKLIRLTKEQIGALSTAMLGPAGQQPALVNLLQQATEGNTFFMVEAIRALAEAAGGLFAIGRMTLPRTILAGGIQQTLQRRLAQIPAAMHPLLQLAAVAGRQLDLAILSRLAPMPLDPWLTTCADAAVVEFYDGGWRFAHDQLRAAVLRQIDEPMRPHLHRQVAETMESLYPTAEARTAQAERLLEHWQQAGELVKTVDYGLLVGRRLVHNAEYQRATSVLRQSVAVAARLPDGDRPAIQLCYWLGKALEEQADYEQAGEAQQQSLRYAQALADVVGQIDALNGAGWVATRQEKWDAATALFQQSLTLAQSLQDQPRIAENFLGLSKVNYEQSNYVAGSRYGQEALTLQRACQNQPGIAVCLNGLGLNLVAQGEYTLADQYLTECLALARAINYRAIIAGSLTNLGVNAVELGDYHAGVRYYTEALALAKELNNQRIVTICLNNLGVTALGLGEWTTAESYFLQALALWREQQVVSASARAFDYLSWIAEQQADWTKAASYYEQSWAIAQRSSHELAQAEALATCARLALWLYNPQQAVATLTDALTIACRWRDPWLLVKALLVALRIALQRGHFQEAARLVGLLDKQRTLLPIFRMMYFDPLVAELHANLPAATLTLAYAEGQHDDLYTVAQCTVQQWQTTR